MLFYTLAVMLPGIFLGYLALRGILNDQALREKESRKKLEMKSQAFFAAVDSDIVHFVKEMSADPVPDQSKKSHPSLLVWYIVNNNGSIKLIIHHLLYLPAELPASHTGTSGQAQKMEEGIRLEFRELRYPEALRFYGDIIRKTGDPAEKIQALTASARLYNKMNQPERAKILYDEIREKYAGSLLNGQIPLGLMSSLEILKINQSLGEKDEMKNTLRQSLELLLHPPCEYGENQFDLFYQFFSEFVREPDPVTDSLLAELDTHKNLTETLVRLINGADLTTTNSIKNLKIGKTNVNYTPVVSDELTAIFLSFDKSEGIQNKMVIDFQTFLQSHAGQLIKEVDPNTSMNIIVEDQAGNPVLSKVLKEETGYLSFPFPGNLPPWKLLLRENKPGFLAFLLKAGSGVYLYIFILIILLMALGFVFTTYTLNGELRLNRMKSEFISNVSHELKSPLTSIRMMTEMLHQNRVGSEERKSEYYSAMLAESEHLSHLIDNILDFSRIDDDRKKYDFSDLDMEDLLKKFIASTRERLPDPGFDIVFRCPDRVPVIRADKNAILQVLHNLVDNAIKFSGTSRQIEINLTSNEEELLFSVKDHGIGISPKDYEKIFDRFFRSDEAQRMGIRGSGIGLTIVKKIIEAHKGSIKIESEPGKGSRFTVSFPVRGI
jgi:signal transduction histidine kinase